MASDGEGEGKSSAESAAQVKTAAGPGRMRKRPARSRETMRRVFDSLDPDEQGTVAFEDVMNTLEEDEDEEEDEEQGAEVDEAEKRRRIKFHEFCHLMATEQDDQEIHLQSITDDDHRVTPPAMERNMFLSALANGKVEHHRHEWLVTAKRMVAGGLAGMVAKSVVAPVDRIKILFQVTNEHFSFHKVRLLAKSIVEHEGLHGLWKGNSATMIRVFPYAGTQFMVFDALKGRILRRRRRKTERLSTLESLVSGSTAGAVSAFATYPLDLARARLAVSTHCRSHAKTAMGGLGKGGGGGGGAAPEGPAAGRGSGVSGTSSRPAEGRRKGGGGSRSSSSSSSSSSSRAKEGGGGVKRHLPGGVYRELTGLWREEGYRALYRGVTPSLAGVVPYAGIAFSINERLKHEVRVFTGKEPQTAHKLAIGAFAGLVAQSCTYPFEVVRRRMQTQGLVDQHSGVDKVFCPHSALDPAFRERPSILQTLQAVLREQGPRALFKGLSMNWIKGPVGISISFTTFDVLKRYMGVDALD